jgi:hypothetical protein
MNDPRILSIVSVIFALMGSYSLYTGSRQMRDARRAGQRLRWYKNISFLTGTEYILLTFVFLLSLSTRAGTISPAMKSLVTPLYFVLLIAAAVTAGMVIRQGIVNTRQNRALRQKAAAEATVARRAEIKAPTEPLRATLSQQDDEQRSRDQSRQRERRRKAAAARRRQAGKA